MAKRFSVEVGRFMSISVRVRIAAMLIVSPPDLERRILTTIKLRTIIGLPSLVRDLNLGRGGVTMVRETVARLIDEGKVERVRSPRAWYRIQKHTATQL